jgi:Flp pilus assembly protein CpaB
MVQVVVAAQNIPRGARITEDNNAVMLKDWPQDALPTGVLTELEAAYDRIARVDLVLGMPVLEGALTDTPGDLGAVGSDAALQVPAGMVAYALPVDRYMSAAWALQAGDRVDVIVSLRMVDLDEEFQSRLLNQARCVGTEEACAGFSGPLGRLEVLPNGWLVNITPSEEQRPRLVTQLTVQDMLVLRVGDWSEGVEATPVPQEEAEQPAAGDEPAEPTPTPTPQPQQKALTLAVTQQDAMVLEHAQEMNARFTFVLRSAGDRQAATTESVTLQYMMDRYRIELPPKLPYGAQAPAAE